MYKRQVQQGFDFIAASFVRTAQDVYDIRNLLNQYDSNIRIIAKIENREGVNNIDSILAAADAVMVARGDLGVEIDKRKIVMDDIKTFGTVQAEVKVYAGITAKILVQVTEA